MKEEAASKEASEKAPVKEECEKADFKESEKEGEVKSFAESCQAMNWYSFFRFILITNFIVKKVYVIFQ